jgi:superfamily II DNA/RNA helicase
MALRARRNAIVHGGADIIEMVTMDADPAVELPNGSSGELDTKELSQLLELLDEVGEEGKISAALSAISGLLAEGRNRIVVFSSYVAAVHALRAALEDESVNSVHVLYGALAQTERWDVVEGFRREGGVLICTDAIAEGLHLGALDACVHFDAPASEIVFQRRMSILTLGGMRGGGSPVAIVLKDTSPIGAREDALWERVGVGAVPS